MKRLPANLLLATALGVPMTTFAADQPWDAPFTIRLGAFSADADTTVRFDATNSSAGTGLSFERDLNMTKRKTLPEFDIVWRLNPRHALEFSYIQLERDGSNTTDRTINWGDVTFPITTTVNSTFDSDVLRAAYRYSLVNEGGNELAFLLGLHYTRLETSLTSGSGTISDSASVDAPLPTLGIRGSLRLSDTLRATGHLQYLKLKVGDYDGELTHASAGVEWAFMPQAFAGLAYNLYRYELNSEKSNARGQFDFRFDGPSLYVGWAFR